MKKKDQITAIFIAYKTEGTLEKFWKEFPRKYFDECILVDDASPDKTFEIAKKLKGLITYQNPTNLGYGGNLKRAVSLALDRGADIIVDIHPDGEYKPSAIPAALGKIQKEGYEFVVGNRFTAYDKPIKSGMYAWKVLPLLALSSIDRPVLGLNLSDFHQGFRVYTKKLFETVNFENNSSSYLFSFELIAQSAFHGIKIGEVPVETRYEGEKRGVSLRISIKYSIDTFKVLALFLLAKTGLKTPVFVKPKGNLESRISRFL